MRGRPSGMNWRRIKGPIKAAIGAVVLYAVYRFVARTWGDLHARGRTLHVDAGWAAASMGLYLAGLGAFGVFYWRILAAGASPMRLAPALRAYLISHLGKYVPGKAMVVVLRAGLSAPFGARPATAAFATLYETLVMMAAGGAIAAAGFALRPLPPIAVPLGVGPPIPLPPLLMSLGLGAAFLVVVHPRVFPRLAGLVRLPFPGVGPEALPRTSVRLLVEGLLLSWAGWALLGLSQVAVARALGAPPATAGQGVVMVASVALATVAGFAVAVLPGGLGVRELIIMATLAPALGTDLAVVSALGLRLSWVLAEVLAAAPFSLYRPEPGRAGLPEEPGPDAPERHPPAPERVDPPSRAVVP